MPSWIERLLTEVIRLVTRRESSSPTREGHSWTPDAGPKHAVMMLSDLFADLLRSRRQRGSTRLDSTLFGELHELVVGMGFDIPKDVHDQRLRKWIGTEFRDQNLSEDMIGDADGEEELARNLVGALRLVRGTSRSSQYELQKALKEPTSPRVIKYREFARYVLACLGIRRSVGDPLADLLAAVQAGNSWDVDRILAALRGALQIAPYPSKKLPPAVYSRQPKEREGGSDP